MRRPERRLLRAAMGVLVLQSPLALAQGDVLPEEFPQEELQELRESLEDSWYRTELLIFVREDDASRAAEQWNPLPKLAYPDEARFLIDPELADRRLAESLAYQSRIDERGVQELIVPAPVRELLDHTRPDAMTVAPPEALLDELLPATDPNTVTAGEALPGEPGVDPVTAGVPDDDSDQMAAAEDPNEPQPDLLSPVFALPYQTLADSELEFRAQARTLRRRGQRVLFHAAWWAPLDEPERTPSLLLDRSGDSDSLDWPALQGSVQIYRSRYLHIALDLWLNTLGEYLPDGWQIDAPPRADASLASMNMAGQPLDPWNPIPEAGTGEAADTELSAEFAEPAEEAVDPEARVDYPWRHAIVHRQSRRMRSGEIHYLDHPVIGVIVRVRAVDEENLPLLPAQELEFRQRHGLPAERLELPAEDSEGEDSGR